MDAYWTKIPLKDMTTKQWEDLCDGCGKCCLSKLEDEDNGDIYYTSVACKLFDESTCRCKDYTNRFAQVADCVKLTPENVETIPWLPMTCAYRLIAEGLPLEPWHPLVSGDPDSVKKAGISVFGKITAVETELKDPIDYLSHIVDEDMNPAFDDED